VFIGGAEAVQFWVVSNPERVFDPVKCSQFWEVFSIWASVSHFREMFSILGSIVSSGVCFLFWGVFLFWRVFSILRSISDLSSTDETTRKLELRRYRALATIS